MIDVVHYIPSYKNAKISLSRVDEIKSYDAQLVATKFFEKELGLKDLKKTEDKKSKKALFQYLVSAGLKESCDTQDEKLFEFMKNFSAYVMYCNFAMGRAKQIGKDNLQEGENNQPDSDYHAMLFIQVKDLLLDEVNIKDDRFKSLIELLCQYAIDYNFSKNYFKKITEIATLFEAINENQQKLVRSWGECTIEYSNNRQGGNKSYVKTFELLFEFIYDNFLPNDSKVKEFMRIMHDFVVDMRSEKYLKGYKTTYYPDLLNQAKILDLLQFSLIEKKSLDSYTSQFLIDATKAGCCDILQHFIKERPGEIKNIKNHEGNILYHAIIEEKTEIVNFLLRTEGLVDVESVTPDKESALHVAIDTVHSTNLNIYLIKTIIDWRPELIFQENEYACSSFAFLVCFEQDIQLVKYLVDNFLGKNLNLNEKVNNEPLIINLLSQLDKDKLSYKVILDLIKFLVENGADTNIKNSKGETFLDLISKNKDIDKKDYEYIKNIKHAPLLMDHPRPQAKEGPDQKVSKIQENQQSVHDILDVNSDTNDNTENQKISWEVLGAVFDS